MNFNEYDKVVQTYMAAVVAEVKSRGKWRDVDMIAMDILAASLHRWRMAERDIREMGVAIGSHQNPSVGVATSSLRTAMGIMQDYGLTQLSLKKLTKGEPEPEEDTPFEAFLRDE